MKSKNIIIVILLSLLVSVCVLHEKSIAKSGKEIAPAKIAVINIEKLMLESQKNKQFEEKYKSEKQQAEAELKNLEKEINTLAESLKSFDPSSKDYADRSRAVMKKQLDHEVKGKFFQQEFANRVLRWREFSFRSIMKEAEKIAKARGYDLVLSKQAQRWPAKYHEELMMVIQTTKVIYNSEDLDITDDVLKAWDSVKTDN